MFARRGKGTFLFLRKAVGNRADARFTLFSFENGAPGGIRTPNLLVRRRNFRDRAVYFQAVEMWTRGQKNHSFFRRK
jgi:hypothetical protein